MQLLEEQSLYTCIHGNMLALVCVGVYMRAWWVGGGGRCGWVCMCGCVTAM